MSEIAEAVEEVKQFVRPTREKVFNPSLFKNYLCLTFFCDSEIPKAGPGVVSWKKTHSEG